MAKYIINIYDILKNDYLGYELYCNILIMYFLYCQRPLLLKDSGEYVYCLRRGRDNPEAPYNPYDLQVVSANTARHAKEYWTVTASFVSKVTDLCKNFSSNI